MGYKFARNFLIAMCSSRVFAATNNTLLPPEQERWEMVVGSTRVLQTPPDQAIRVSRRGIVDFSVVDNSHWSIAALQRGVVSVSWGASESDSGKRLLIEVQAKEDHKRLRKADAEQEAVLAWKSICPMLTSLTCNDDLHRIEGETSNWHEMDLAKSLCKTNPLCSLEGRLSVKGQEDLKIRVQNMLGVGYRVLISDFAQVQVWHDCPEKDSNSEEWIQALLSPLGLRESLTFACFKSWPKRGYKLGAKIQLIDETVAQELGLVPDWDVQVPLINAKGQASLFAKLKDQADSQLISTVAEPVVRLINGSVVHLASGGEIQASGGLISHKNDLQTGDSVANLFKRYGVELTAMVTPTEGENLQLNYNISLSHRLSDQGERLQIHSTGLSGDVYLKPGIPTLAGTTILNSDEEGTRSSSVLSSIPILAPLLQSSSRGETKKRALVWLMINEDNSEEQQISFPQSFPNEERK